MELNNKTQILQSLTTYEKSIIKYLNKNKAFDQAFDQIEANINSLEIDQENIKEQLTNLTINFDSYTFFKNQEIEFESESIACYYLEVLFKIKLLKLIVSKTNANNIQGFFKDFYYLNIFIDLKTLIEKYQLLNFDLKENNQNFQNLGSVRIVGYDPYLASEARVYHKSISSNLDKLIKTFFSFRKNVKYLVNLGDSFKTNEFLSVEDKKIAIKYIKDYLIYFKIQKAKLENIISQSKLLLSEVNFFDLETLKHKSIVYLNTYENMILNISTFNKIIDSLLTMIRDKKAIYINDKEIILKKAEFIMNFMDTNDIYMIANSVEYNIKTLEQFDLLKDSLKNGDHLIIDKIDDIDFEDEEHKEINQIIETKQLKVEKSNLTVEEEIEVAKTAKEEVEAAKEDGKTEAKENIERTITLNVVDAKKVIDILREFNFFKDVKEDIADINDDSAEEYRPNFIKIVKRIDWERVSKNIEKAIQVFENKDFDFNKESKSGLIRESRIKYGMHRNIVKEDSEEDNNKDRNNRSRDGGNRSGGFGNRDGGRSRDGGNRSGGFGNRDGGRSRDGGNRSGGFGNRDGGRSRDGGNRSGGFGNRDGGRSRDGGNRSGGFGNRDGGRSRDGNK
ncbi:DEAD/DEAH box helicase [Spiroplasma gladiatoris]|uniref:DEAD/DEAH box helicase n=1 Tax=Spiroplasma gladiatoris TaxID=2143 RepID=A0A4P7AIY6_9MOLU|nr:hypothetical protein [Spiroplasma gladiatoris]QBQ07738.1 DEAD/DEAH box helicase [Spiroplasma gladiatoris]